MLVKKKIILIGIFLLCFLRVNSQELAYVSPNAYNWSKSTHTNTLPTLTRELTPTGGTFNSDGSKFYSIGRSTDKLVQYNLTSNYDLSTATYEKNLDTSTEDGNAQSITFNNTGSKMYIVGSSNDKIYEYALATNYDIATATHNAIDDLDVSDPDGDTVASADPTAMVFNNNGTKMFLVDRTNVAPLDAIYEYSLTVAYDISTATVTGASTLNINGTGVGKENTANGISFNGTGTRLYIAGDSGNDITIYNLSPAYDLSTAVYNSRSSISAEELRIQEVLFNNTGTKLYIIGHDGDDVTQYSLTGAAYDVTTRTIDTTLDTQSLENTPSGITFNNDGSKMYIYGYRYDNLVEYNLSTRYDITTASYNTSIYLRLIVDGNISSFRFNDTGSKLFLLGNTADTVFQFNLATNFDISTATDSGFSFLVDIGGTETDVRGLAFNKDGTKMFIAGNTLNNVYEYTLSIGFDLSGASTKTLVNTLSINSEEATVSGVDFGFDGKKMFIIGRSGDEINTYDLSPAFDTTTTTFNNFFKINTEENSASDLIISADGSKLFILGFANDKIYDYLIADLGDDIEDAVLNNGSISATPTLNLKLTGDTFVNLGSGALTIGGGNQVVIGNVPAGLTPVLTLSSGNTVATLSFTGTATAHQNVDSVTNLTFTFNNSAFTGGAAAGVTDAVGYSSNIGVEFFDNNYRLVYIGPNSYNVDNLEYTSTSFSVAANETYPEDVVFNNTGSKMYIIGRSGDDINEYDLSTNYNISTAVYNQNFLVKPQDTNPTGLTFNNNGTKMFVIGTTNDNVYEYDISIPYDISTAVFNQQFDISATGETFPQAIQFNNDGTKMFFLGYTTDTLYEYNLGTPYDISTAVISGTTISLNDSLAVTADGRESAPRAFVFSYDGMRLFYFGNSGDDINEALLSAPYNISAPTYTRRYSITNLETIPTGLAFNPDGTKLVTIGYGTDTIYEFDVISDFMEETSTNNGTLIAGQTLEIYIEGDTFVDAGGLTLDGTQVSIANIPATLTHSISLNAGRTKATLTFGSTATNHTDADDVASLDFTFNNTAYTTVTTTEMKNDVGYVTNIGVNFNFCPRNIRYNIADWIGGSGTGGRPNTTDGTKGIYVNDNVSMPAHAVSKCIEITAGNSYSLNTNRRLEVSDMVRLDGELRLIGTSQLLQTHAGTRNIEGTGNLFMDQTSINTDVFQSGYWTSPVTTNGSTFTISGVLKDGTIPTSAVSNPLDINFTDIHTLDGDSGTSPITISGRWLAKLINAVDWTRQISPTAVTFNPGEGFNMKGLGANFTFKGQINDGDYSSSIDQNMLSLIGNPYPSALDATQFITDNVEGGVNPAIVGTLYFWEAGNAATHYRGSYTGGYATRTSVGGTAFNAKTPSRYIAVGQAFFVWRSVAGTGTIDFNNNQRLYRTIGGSDQFYGKTASNKTTNKNTDGTGFPKIKVGFEFVYSPEKIFHRQVLIAFNGMTNVYDNGFDGEMFDRQPSDMALKTDDWPSDFVITAIENFNDAIEIPLSVYLDKTRNVTFKIDSIENLSHNLFYLKDAVNNTYYDLSNSNSVTLNINAGEYLNRFFITFKNPSLGIDDTSLVNNLTIYIDNLENEIVIKTMNSPITEVKLFNLLGQEIHTFKNTLNKSSLRLKLPKNISTNVYILKLKTKTSNYSKKILIE